MTLRAIWPVALLLVFFTTIRGLSDQAAPAEAAIDCDRVAAGDVAALERCLALHPDDVEVMSDLGAVYETLDRWERAEAVYRRALTIDPQDGDVHVRLGVLLLRRADFEGAAREGHAALFLQPARPAAQNLIDRAGTRREPAWATAVDGNR